MKIIDIKVEKLIPYVNNPRDNKDAIDKVASSIKEFGFKVPLVIDKDNIVITGHTRLSAAKKLGIEKVPCVIADDLSEAQIKAFRIADNRVAEYSKWDDDLLKVEMDRLKELDFNNFDFDFALGDDDLVIPDFSMEEESEQDAEGEEDVFSEESLEEEQPENEGIIQYNIIFNNKAEQEVWQSFIVFLKETYKGETISERLINHIKEFTGHERE